MWPCMVVVLSATSWEMETCMPLKPQSTASVPGLHWITTVVCNGSSRTTLPTRGWESAPPGKNTDITLPVGSGAEAEAETGAAVGAGFAQARGERAARRNRELVKVMMTVLPSTWNINRIQV